MEKFRGVFGRPGHLERSASGPSNFLFYTKKGKSTAEVSCVLGGVLTILGVNLSSGGGVGLAYCKGGDRQFCAQLRADARNGVQKGGSAILSAILGSAILGSAILGSAILRQFWVGNSSAILLHKVVFEELPIGNSFLRIADTQNCRPLELPTELPTHPFAHHCAHLRGIARRIDDPHPCGTPRQITVGHPSWAPQTS